jgi:hypothetical protein
VNSSFEQLLHCDRGQWASFVDCIRAGFAFPGLNPLMREIGNASCKFQVVSFQFPPIADSDNLKLITYN